jgi:Tol biopolymer transport system component
LPPRSASTVIRLLAASALAAAAMVAGCSGDNRARPDLVFVSTRDGDYSIYEMNADGGGQRRLTHAETDASKPEELFFQVEPAWSPDGTKIAFSSRRGRSFDIYLMNADGTGTRRLTSTGENDSHPTWSADGSRIAFARSGSGDIYVMDADGSGARRISDPTVEEAEPAWSPDGAWIAYVRRIPGTPARDVWLVRPDGSGRHAVTSQHARTFTPAWAPDSRQIAFASDAASSFFDIYVIGVDGKGLRRRTRTGSDAFEPAWSPDAATIAFSRNGSIVTIDQDGNEEELTDPEDNDSSPAWKPVLPAEEEK